MLFEAGFELLGSECCTLASFVGNKKTCMEVFSRALRSKKEAALPSTILQTRKATFERAKRCRRWETAFCLPLSPHCGHSERGDPHAEEKPQGAKVRGHRGAPRLGWRFSSVLVFDTHAPLSPAR